MIIHSYICAFSTENLIAYSHIRVSIVTTYLKCQDIVKPMPPYSLFKISLCVWLAGWWASLATTRKMQQCVNVLTDMYYATVSLLYAVGNETDYYWFSVIFFLSYHGIKSARRRGCFSKVSTALKYYTDVVQQCTQLFAFCLAFH